MVVSNVGTEKKTIHLNHCKPTFKDNSHADEWKVEENEWRVAAETVLPHLLGHSSFAKNQPAINFHHEKEKNTCSRSYVDAIYDFGRWIGAVGSCLRRWKLGAKRRKLTAVQLTTSRLKDFLILLEDVRIKRFLEEDGCKIFADSYLLAMVFTYFLRAGFTANEYNYRNFFTALVLAHEIEEENYAVEVMVMELETEVILENKEEFIPIHRLRYELFVRMDYRALVSRKCCEEIISLYPEHWAWKRKRNDYHSGVFQNRRYPSQQSDDQMFWFRRSGRNRTSNQQCDSCITFEKRNLEIAAKLEARSAGNRLTLKRRLYSSEVKIEKKHLPGTTLLENKLTIG